MSYSQLNDLKQAGWRPTLYFSQAKTEVPFPYTLPFVICCCYLFHDFTATTTWWHWIL